MEKSTPMRLIKKVTATYIAAFHHMKKITLLTHIFDLVELHSTMGAIEKKMTQLTDIIDLFERFHSMFINSGHFKKKKKENNDKNYRIFFGEFTVLVVHSVL